MNRVTQIIRIYFVGLYKRKAYIKRKFLCCLYDISCSNIPYSRHQNISFYRIVPVITTKGLFRNELVRSQCRYIFY